MTTRLVFEALWRGQDAERGLKNLGDRSNRVGQSLKSVAKIGGAALAAVGVAAIKLGADSVRAYTAAQTEQAKLSDAYRRFPKLADVSIGALRRYNSELALKTKFDDDATASGQSVLAQFKLTGTQIRELTPLLQDYAARTGKDMPTAARDLGKAMLGQGRSLKSVGINFKDTGTAGGNFEQIMKGLRTQVGGFAENEGKTAAGRAAILRNRFGELQEGLGEKLLPVLIKVFDYLEAHESDIVKMFVKAGSAALGFGGGMLRVSAAVIRAIGTIDSTVGRFLAGFIDFHGKILTAATKAFGWVPGLGPKLKAAKRDFDHFATGAKKGLEDQGRGALAAADKLDRYASAAEDGQRKLDKLGRTEIDKARNREMAVRVAKAIDGIGKSGDVARLKLKGYNIESGRGTRAQREFAARVHAARGRMLEQRDAGIKAGDSQAKLTRRWDEGRAALRREFIQMGYSKAEAKRLAAQYTKIPGKKETKVSAPGAKKAAGEIRDVDRAIENTKGKTVNVDVNVNSGVNKLNKAILKKYGTKGIQIALAGGGPVPGYSSSETSDNVDARLTPGEWVIRRRSARRYGPHAMKAVNEGRASIGYASGGPVRHTANTAAHGSYYNPARFRDLLAGDSASAGRAASHAAGVQALRAASSAAISAAKAAQSAAESATSGTPGGKVGSVNRGMAATIAAMRRAGARSFTTYPGHGERGSGKSRDVTPHSWAIANAARRSSSVWYVIYRMRIASKNRGNVWRQYTPISRRGDFRHVRHVHVSWYGGGTRNARGGTAIVGENGPELLQMRGGERVTPLNRYAIPSYARAAGAGNTTIIINAPNYVGSQSDLRDTIVKLHRDGKLKVLHRA